MGRSQGCPVICTKSYITKTFPAISQLSNVLLEIHINNGYKIINQTNTVWSYLINRVIIFYLIYILDLGIRFCLEKTSEQKHLKITMDDFKVIPTPI